MLHRQNATFQLKSTETQQEPSTDACHDDGNPASPRGLFWNPLREEVYRSFCRMEVDWIYLRDEAIRAERTPSAFADRWIRSSWKSHSFPPEFRAPADFQRAREWTMPIRFTVGIYQKRAAEGRRFFRRSRILFFSLHSSCRRLKPTRCWNSFEWKLLARRVYVRTKHSALRKSLRQRLATHVTHIFAIFPRDFEGIVQRRRSVAPAITQVITRRHIAVIKAPASA